MAYILQGIGDYIKDWWHDLWFWFWDKIDNFVTRRLHHTYCWRHNEALYTKEGNLWHYIQQRKAAKLLKEIKLLKKELNKKERQCL